MTKDRASYMIGKKTGFMGRIRWEIDKQNCTASSTNSHFVENFEAWTWYESCDVRCELYSVSWT